MNTSKKDGTKREKENDAEMYRVLCRNGDDLAKTKRYRTHKGMDAIHFYLVQKYHWLPSQVRDLTLDDIAFLLD